MAKDYYNILGINKTASKDEVKKAFHKLAHKYHPDKSGGDDKQFKEINEAYQILSNDKKRSEYDMYGNVFQGADGSTSGFGSRGGASSSWDFSNFANGQGFEFDLGDIFSEFFSGGETGGGRMRRGRDISVDIQISFAESVFGTERKILINKIGECDHCRTTGAELGTSSKECSTCGGKGKVHETRRSFIGSFSSVRECSACHGKGQVPKTPCGQCRGAGVLKKSEEIKIKVPAGIQDGEMIRLSSKGEAVAGGVAGDLYIKIHADKHSVWRREGNNLLMDLNIKLTDALLGVEYKVATLDGDINLNIPAGISFGEILRVKEKGVPTTAHHRGDLLIKIVINTPKKFSHTARKKIEELREEGM